ncbi:undecaprenyl-diphosphatase [Bradyrhizobium sp. USDA 4472]
MLSSIDLDHLVDAEARQPVTDFLVGLDVSIFRALNDFCGWSPALDRIVVNSIDILKGALFMGIVGLLWYWPDKEMPRRRETVLTMLLVVAASLIINRALSTLVPFRERPMYSIGANPPSMASPWHPDLENWSSFPSDYATYLFAIAASFWLISRWWGLFFGLFATFVAVARVYLGIHYPSDVLVGALIGIASSIVINREPVRRRFAAPILALEPRYTPYFYGLFFIGLAEISGAFQITRRFGMAILHLFIGFNR